jgi:hypothetical protein
VEGSDILNYGGENMIRIVAELNNMRYVAVILAMVLLF